LTAITAAFDEIITDKVYDVELAGMNVVACNSRVTRGSINAIAPLRSGGHSSGYEIILKGIPERMNTINEK
jgi:hypothetical protein